MNTFKTWALALIPAAMALGVVATGAARRPLRANRLHRLTVKIYNRRRRPASTSRRCWWPARPTPCCWTLATSAPTRCAARQCRLPGQQEDAEDHYIDRTTWTAASASRSWKALPGRQGGDHRAHAQEDRRPPDHLAAGLGPAHGRQRPQDRALPLPDVLAGNTIPLEDQTLEIRGLDDSLPASAASCGFRRSRPSPAA